MSAPKKIQSLVSGILKEEARRGHTTKQTVVAKAMAKITQGGGPARYGIGHAYVIHATAQAVSSETDRQFKQGLPENVFRMSMRNAPPALVQTMHKLPQWIAIGEGPGADWVPSLQATAEQWMENFYLKRRIAERTMQAATVSEEMARYLDQHGMQSLSEIFRE
jgi:hypothetical protein